MQSLAAIIRSERQQTNKQQATSAPVIFGRARFALPPIDQIRLVIGVRF
jgi:hypothetical protein